MKKTTAKKLITLLLAITAMMFLTAASAFATEEAETDPALDVDVPEAAADEMDPEAADENVVALQATLVDLKDVDMILPGGNTYTETGSEIKPAVRLEYNGTELIEGTDYTLEYSANNIKPGTASVTAKAIENSSYTGSHSVDFTITAKPVSLSNASIKLNSTRYAKTGSAIKPAPILTYDGEKLRSGMDYTLSYKNNVNAGKATITATAKSGSRFTGTKSITFTIVPKKPAAAPISQIKSNKPNVNVTWKKVTCTGYELQVSLNSNFSGATKYKLTATSKNIPKLKNGKKYYFRTRAYKTENSLSSYSAWSTSSSKVKTTGPVGNKYSKNGAYIKDETIKYDGNTYYYNEDGLKSGCSEKMWDKVKNTSSKTKYLIAVDCTKNRTCIYKGKKGNWELKDYWKCTTGKKSTPTIKGKFKVCGKVSHFGEQKGYSVWYATRIKYEYYFHSILYKPWSKSSVLSGTLGKNKSHGCIRLKLKNAKWIYKNCKSGTRIVIY